MDVRTRLERARGRLDLPVIGRIGQSALAAGAAWELALQIPRHDQPFFAPIAAVIALGSERGRRGRQAFESGSGSASPSAPRRSSRRCTSPSWCRRASAAVSSASTS